MMTFSALIRRKPEDSIVSNPSGNVISVTKPPPNLKQLVPTPVISPVIVTVQDLKSGFVAVQDTKLSNHRSSYIRSVLGSYVVVSPLPQSTWRFVPIISIDRVVPTLLGNVTVNVNVLILLTLYFLHQYFFNEFAIIFSIIPSI